MCLVLILGCVFEHRVAVAEEGKETARVVGIGGVFFLSSGKAKSLSSWYEKHLGCG